MSGQSGSDDAAMTAALLVCAVGLIAFFMATILAVAALLAWLGFSIAYPKKSAHYTTWGLFGVLILAAFTIFWNYLYLWDIPIFRAGVISFLVFVPAIWGLWLFASVPSNSLFFRLIKITLMLPFLGGGVYWLINGANVVYDAVYCTGALADAKATVVDGFARVNHDNNYGAAFSEGWRVSSTCGQAHDIEKTAVFFSLFGFLPLLYFPFGLLHSWVEKNRRFRPRHVSYAIDNLLYEPEPQLAAAPTPARTSTRYEPDDPKRLYSAPPFGGR